jgi:hypothetical protein
MHIAGNMNFIPRNAFSGPLWFSFVSKMQFIHWTRLHFSLLLQLCFLFTREDFKPFTTYTKVYRYFTPPLQNQRFSQNRSPYGVACCWYWIMPIVFAYREILIYRSFSVPYVQMYLICHASVCQIINITET